MTTGIPDSNSVKDKSQLLRYILSQAGNSAAYITTWCFAAIRLAAG